MSGPRLKTGIWVSAQLRICDKKMIPAAIIKRGDNDAGGVLIKINKMGQGCEVMARVLDGDGERVWMAVAGGGAENAQQHIEAERNSDDYIKRELNIDPDLWVIEIEDSKGEYAPDV
ncbi:MAG: DUF1491 family protein [Rhodospirillaceae bacterium]|nr:DUF1491 family protein [Rhodospirillaceae bacterium]